MFNLVPVEITSSMLGAGTSIPEDPTPAWTAATYNVGDERHVVATHRVYKCTTASYASTVSPQLDPSNWKDMRPTNKMAPFDIYTNTTAKAITTLTFVINPGFFNAIWIDGMIGSHLDVVVRDAPASASPPGNIIGTLDVDLFDSPGGWYEWLFSPYGQVKKQLLADLVPYPDAEITVTISAVPGDPVEIGMIAVGDFRPIVDAEFWGATEHGSSAEPVTFSYVDTDEDGVLTIVKRHSTTNLRTRVKMDRQAADGALMAVQEVLDVPCLWAATTAPGYAGLSTFGLASGSISYDSYGDAVFNMFVKGTP